MLRAALTLSWHLKEDVLLRGGDRTQTHPTSVFGERTNHVTKEAAACIPPLFDWYRPHKLNRAERGWEQEQKRHSSREDLQSKTQESPPTEAAGWQAHHGRLWSDRRWAVLLLPSEPHLGDLLRAGRAELSPSRLRLNELSVANELLWKQVFFLKRRLSRCKFTNFIRVTL